ncbi:hypothetical protein A3A93_06495 [Candidatus Roizmanbacteria bacterium RIFCSPLOWO2_01_FULL_38_12]|uniref:Uncharacterized protein n=1 Tax=Candidatus Roizmanbacteria bacterium RIFCSPLOWO2_01_FULL_38_12 TaxID=1802061 RepID=A0A1F7IU22_9BACT|nr:MAG: hypothetical protein A3A93_06495 [Candidatus Roizmanbacteria bacterium RIFCSPLOWO2_01_FULL_38_12]
MKKYKKTEYSWIFVVLVFIAINFVYFNFDHAYLPFKVINGSADQRKLGGKFKELQLKPT